MPDAHDGLAAAVRNALETGNQSVHQVSAETRIRAALVQDLLDGRTVSSGGDVYVRGHLRAIAHATGSDAAPLIAAYEAQTGARLDLPDLEHTVHLEGQRAGSLALPMAQKPERTTPRWGLAVGAAAVVLIGLVVVGNVLGGDEDGRAEASPPTTPATTAPPRPAATTPAPTTTPPRVSGAALRVQVAGGSSWVQVRNGTNTLFEGVLDAGTVRDFRDPAALTVRVGNAGAVSLTCAGRGASAGTAGQVKSFTCAPSGLSAV